MCCDRSLWNPRWWMLHHSMQIMEWGHLIQMWWSEGYWSKAVRKIKCCILIILWTSPYWQHELDSIPVTAVQADFFFESAKFDAVIIRLGGVEWGADDGSLLACAAVDRGSSRGGCGICGWINCPLLSILFQSCIPLFSPPQIFHTPFCPYSPNPVHDSHILLRFQLWDPMLKLVREASVTWHETSWIAAILSLW